jgi:hypothetical protein
MGFELLKCRLRSWNTIATDILATLGEREHNAIERNALLLKVETDMAKLALEKRTNRQTSAIADNAT